jgi:hypothetical protein
MATNQEYNTQSTRHHYKANKYKDWHKKAIKETKHTTTKGVFGDLLKKARETGT